MWGIWNLWPSIDVERFQLEAAKANPDAANQSELRQQIWQALKTFKATKQDICDF